MEILTQPEGWLALATLTFMEIVLGIDNIIFISIATNKLPLENRAYARGVGLSLALVVRIFLLLTISWIVQFNTPLFSFLNHSFSGRDIILGLGGLFLIGKSTSEIHHGLEALPEKSSHQKKGYSSMKKVILQIILLDIVFSFDSILTAVGLTHVVLIMIIAVTVAMCVMLLFSKAISRFIKSHPSMEVLALGFLILIGFMLLLEAFHFDIPKGYIYFAVAFSMTIEMINIRVVKKRSLMLVDKIRL